eukprot:2178356-Amphidinium_carterae.1
MPSGLDVSEKVCPSIAGKTSMVHRLSWMVTLYVGVPARSTDHRVARVAVLNFEATRLISKPKSHIRSRTRTAPRKLPRS